MRSGGVQHSRVLFVQSRMRFAAAFLLLLPLTFIACQSTNDDEPPVSPRGGRGGRGGFGGGYGRGDDDGAMMRGRAANGAFDFMPPADWWRDPQLANAVNLTTDQVASLEKISKDAGDDAEKIERDSTVAMRDLKTLLASDKPVEADIVTAGNRIREMRDGVFDRQLKMLAAERVVLSKQQWQTLQEQLEARRSERGRDRGGYPGRGGFPGRGGRRPGFPG